MIRSGGALENLGHATTLVMDKTGTLTMGRPVVIDVAAAPGRDATEMLRLAASVDQLSPHVLAEAIVTEALARGLQLSLPTEVIEEPGRGVTATIGGRRMHVGKLPADTVTARMGARGGEPGPTGRRRDRVGLHRRASRPARCCCGTRCAATRRAPCAACAPPG